MIENDPNSYIMWCCKRDVGEKQTEAKREWIKPFHITFRIITFCMSVGMLYPNPATDKTRITTILFMYLTLVPVSTMLVIDIFNSWQVKDITNIIRHCTILVPFSLVVIKMYLMYHHRQSAKKIMDEIDRDHEQFNFLPEEYRAIVDDHIREAKFGEKYWLAIVFHCVMVFPFMSSSLILYSYMFKAEPRKYMIHDVNKPFSPPEARFESPYFEIIYVYMLYCCIVYTLNFVGYDGFYGIAIRHACLQMRLYCRALEDAMKQENVEDITKRIVEVVRAQVRVYRFVETIQKIFNFWLGMIFTGTVVHVCNCMYQIMVGIGFDLIYFIFIIGSVVHIYLPCNHASRLKSMAADTSTMIYCSGWENVNDLRVKKMITFMIARAQVGISGLFQLGVQVRTSLSVDGTLAVAQEDLMEATEDVITVAEFRADTIPLVITAFNILTFDMELFVSILHTSYSMFTILRPSD